MKLGIMVRNMGPASTPALIAQCARYAEDIGLDDVWVCDHLAIPPDDAEGSGGRYLDPLATLAYLAGITSRIELGVTVLIVPYRPPLPTAKWVATVQELSGGRLLLGVGVGWMAPEFKALGVNRARRGALTDETLDFLNQCFAQDEVTLNAQRFLFKPRPAKPPILIGGSGAHCVERVVRHGDGWMPMTSEPEKLRAPIAELTRRMQAAGKAAPAVIPLGGLPLGDRVAARERVQAFAEVGATAFVHGGRYTMFDEFKAMADQLALVR
ncbi:MAG: TIGR03619 family F420-dependent LLM class oxidoreductase [Gammaproteobacteria bacterium]|nr:TIGR03619 family F420-dependent LLM class oxidoreductase [Gammaproteobacteria bacterium]